jgi:hypothetical protein
MKRIASVGLTTWMLEHLTFGPHREALSGDLLEELRHGRSATWYRRQAVSAIAIGLLRKSREYSLPVSFSFGWSMLYPVWWLAVERSQLAQTIFTRWSTLDWPYSTASTLLCSALPAITFVWLGFFIYLLSQPHITRQLSTLRLLRSLSISFNVLLGIWIFFRHTVINVHSVNSEGLVANTHLFGICIPFALSLFSAISSVRPHAQHRNTAPLAG